MQDWKNRKLFKILFKLLCLHFPPLHIRTYVFRTCIFHPPVLSFSVLALSVALTDEPAFSKTNPNYPRESFREDYVITGVRLSVCRYHDN